MNTSLVIFGGTLLLGLFIFLFLVFKKVKKHKAIKHYEGIRDGLTLREKEEKEKELDYKNYSGLNIGNLIGGFIVVLIGLSLLPTIINETNNYFETQQINATDTFAQTQVDVLKLLVPTFVILAIVSTAIALASSAFRKCEMV